jgi:hypothetical protein
MDNLILYRIIAPGSLTPLFALHAYYANMQNPNDPTRLSASKQMRGLLRETMVNTMLPIKMRSTN